MLANSPPSPQPLRAALPWWRRAWMWALALATVLACGMGTVALARSGLQPVPALSGQVIDQTGTLSAEQRETIGNRLAAIEQRLGTQIVVLMVDTTEPEDIAPYAHRVADDWKIGRADVGDGLLLVIAKDDRRVRLEVARALEGTLPDILAARIIDQRITPGFRSGDFAGGILAGIDAIEATLAGEEALPPPSTRARPGSSAGAKTPDWPTLLVVAYFALTIGAPMLRQLLGRKLGALASGSAVAVVMYLLTGWLVVALIAGAISLLLAFTMGGQLGVASGTRRGGRGGWGGGSGGFGGGGFSGGGGFRSGGGGSFGGGGASGRW